MTIAFIDTETTSLDRDRREPWDIAVIIEGHPTAGVDGEYQAFLAPEKLHLADPGSVRFSRMYERLPAKLLPGDSLSGPEVVFREQDPDNPVITAQGIAPVEKCRPKDWSHRTFASWLCRTLDGATVVGAVPSFDEETLFRYAARNGYVLTNHYHLVDIEPLALGYLMAEELYAARDAGDEPQTRWRDAVRNPPYSSDDIWTALGVQIPTEQRHTALGDARQVRRAWRVLTGQADQSD